MLSDLKHCGRGAEINYYAPRSRLYGISHLQRAEIRGEYLLTTHCGNPN
jgi:hypothetical protein